MISLTNYAVAGFYHFKTFQYKKVDESNILWRKNDHCRYSLIQQVLIQMLLIQDVKRIWNAVNAPFII